MTLLIREANPATRQLLNLPVNDTAKAAISMYVIIEDGVEKNQIIGLLKKEGDGTLFMLSVER